MANDTKYGLASYVYTQNLARAWRVVEQLRFGMVGVNDINPTSAAAPFGGVKQSGQGRRARTKGLWSTSTRNWWASVSDYRATDPAGVGPADESENGCVRGDRRGIALGVCGEILARGRCGVLLCRSQGGAGLRASGVSRSTGNRAAGRCGLSCAGAERTVDAVEQAAEIGAGGVITCAAGFTELGDEGVRLQQRMVEGARAGNMPVVGPNGVGLMNVPGKLHLSMLPIFRRRVAGCRPRHTAAR